MNDLLKDLLTYIEQVEKLKSVPAFTVPEEYFSVYQSELRGLPGVSFDPKKGDSDTWLTISRLSEILPPEPNDEISNWVTIFKSPEKKPELKPEITLKKGDAEYEILSLEDYPDVKIGFDWYVENIWTPWSEAEKPRRRTIGIYNQLFSIRQTLGSTLEIVWGVGLALWREPKSKKLVKHPLLTHPCEVHIDEDTYEISIVPRNRNSYLELDCYLSMDIKGYSKVEEFWSGYKKSSGSQIDPFDVSTYDQVLRNAVAHLDSSGTYLPLPDDMQLPEPNENLLVTDSYVIFVRKKTQGPFIEDLHKLKEALNNSDVPEVLKMLVTEGSEEVSHREMISFRGLSSSFGGENVKELYFPMPYNEEQVSIIQKLETSFGVVVQGPPGTGKTHTIANVICHYLAQGKKVLVTAKSESALKVLQEKLPEKIKPLSVALLTDEQDGMKKFEHSIQLIASTVGEIDPYRVNKEIEGHEATLARLHAKISNLDKEINEYAASHMCTHQYMGRDVEIAELAKIVSSNLDKISWFNEDLNIESLEKIDFTDADLIDLKNSRLAVAEDLIYAQLNFPIVDELPSWIEVLSMHQDICKSRHIDEKVLNGKILPIKDASTATYERIPALLSFLEDRRNGLAKLNLSTNLWIKDFQKKYFKLSDSDPVKKTFAELLSNIQKLHQEQRTFIASAISMPEAAKSDPDVLEGLNRLSEGKSIFPIPFTKGSARTLIGSIQVLGSALKSSDEYRLIIAYLDWIKRVEQQLAIWNSLCPEFNVPFIDSVDFKNLIKASELANLMLLSIEVDKDYESNLTKKIESVFGKKVVNEAALDNEHLELIEFSLNEHGSKFSLNAALSKKGEIAIKLENFNGEVSRDLDNFFNLVIGSDIAEDDLRSKWLFLIDRLKYLSSKRGDFNTINSLCERINGAGAKDWSKRLLNNVAIDGDDPEYHSDWFEVWNLRVGKTVLSSIDDHDRFMKMFKDRKSTTLELSKTYQEIIASKTWLGVQKNSPDSVRSALQAYLNAIQKIGAGTGKRAPRYRLNAQSAMEKAYKAVPCWILPQWRVSESLPAELGLFDLVVIDEASQSDIWALPSIMRGKKLLIVGDHKQVSPLAIGTAETRIQDLLDRFLPAQPHGEQMSPEKSIYDLGRVVFAGNSIMLREHFRCVSPIIEFSNREFYEGEIKPLRVPLASERLDPPLIDVFVKGGFKKGEINPPEALAIVNEIQKIIEDPSLRGRTIGVVTLRGIEQAKHISSLISQRIDQKEILLRKIDVGQPAYFQGSERDIMMVSLVLAPGDVGAPNRADMEQRFNVALSRARDRMYLFRSVQLSDYKEDSLTARVIRHFNKPFTQDASTVKTARELCESDFELEIFDFLVAKNYRVTPQVKCGAYRIDLVVEGSQGRRLAVECDGDRYHGPGQWSDDMARQRVLERAGWSFWRCFASSFSLRRSEVLEDLIATLDKMQVDPIGSAEVDNTMWVSYIEVDPFESEEREDETLF